MQRNLTALADDTFDLTVIGGGIFGAAVALDAAQRGLRVALLERGDFGGATSAHSYKMLHGGIRYLQHGDVARIRHSAAARAAFLRVAPHLAHPLPIAVPTYGRFGMKSRPVLQAGMALYDLLTLGCNRGIADPCRRIPRSRMLSRAETLRRFPGLPAAGLTGAGVFCDGQMYNPTRLVLAFVRSAADLGAVCVNHCEARRLIVRRDRVVAVRLLDRISGQDLEVRTRFVVNAAGPYAEKILLASFDHGLSPPTPFSRDAYFIVPRPVIEGDHALTIPTGTSDPDAVLSRGGRHLFLVPWRGVTLVGVWHKVYAGDPDRYAITEADLASWVAEINEAYPAAEITLDEITLGSAGLVPFGENDPNSQNLKFAHRSRIVEHRAQGGIDGLITLVGVRYTTGPADATDVVNRVLACLDCPPDRSRLAWTPVHGGAVHDFDALVGQIADSIPASVDDEVARALAHNHGQAVGEVLEQARGRPELLRPLPGSAVLGAEIVHAARAEMAYGLDDALFRRTDLCTAQLPSAAALQEAAMLMAETCAWSTDRREAEVARVRSRLDLARTGRAFLADGELATMPSLVDA
jgi:glycerol-3-phosphate dehydrogenase